DELNRRALRRMAVLRPLKVILENVPEGETHECELPNNPEDPDAGKRIAVWSRELWIEQDDFMETPAPGFHRLSPGKSVRLRGAGFLTCTGLERDASGAPVAVRGTWSPPETKLKVKATIHWVSARHARPAEVRIYDRLFKVADLSEIPEEADFKDYLNPDSLSVAQAWVEPALAEAEPGARIQFERIGYFCADAKDHRPGAPVFNRTLTLKDAWARPTSAPAS
ncbi:MAG: glutamine--tRNA ligase, partial [Kiritimatiellae bacterium]|nr:glutamine--tRNA ligase [Kiritimatiellia bacterium]